MSKRDEYQWADQYWEEESKPASDELAVDPDTKYRDQDILEAKAQTPDPSTIIQPPTISRLRFSQSPIILMPLHRLQSVPNSNDDENPRPNPCRDCVIL